MWLFSKLCWRISWSDQADPHHIVIFSIFIWNKNAKHLENEDSSLEEQLKALSPHSRCLIPVLLPCCSCSARPLLFCIGISAWQMALSQDAASTPACTQNTSEAVSSSKEWPWSPGNTGTDRWDGPRTCSTSDRGISYHREKEVTSKKKTHLKKRFDESCCLLCSTWCWSHSGTEWCSSSPRSNNVVSSEKNKNIRHIWRFTWKAPTEPWGEKSSASFSPARLCWCGAAAILL